MSAKLEKKGLMVGADEDGAGGAQDKMQPVLDREALLRKISEYLK